MTYHNFIFYLAMQLLGLHRRAPCRKGMLLNTCGIPDLSRASPKAPYKTSMPYHAPRDDNVRMPATPMSSCHMHLPAAF